MLLENKINFYFFNVTWWYCWTSWWTSLLHHLILIEKDTKLFYSKTQKTSRNSNAEFEERIVWLVWEKYSHFFNEPWTRVYFGMWKKNNTLQLHWQKLNLSVLSAKLGKQQNFLCLGKMKIEEKKTFVVVSVKKSKRKNLKKKWNQTFKFMSIKCDTSLFLKMWEFFRKFRYIVTFDKNKFDEI